MWKTWKFFVVLTLRKESDRNKEWTLVEFELGTVGSENTELPTKPRGSWRVQLIEKAIILSLVSLSYGGSGQAQVSSDANTSNCTCKWLAVRAHLLPPRNGGRDRALLQNYRRKFLKSFPFSFIPKDYCVTRIAIMVEVKNLNIWIFFKSRWAHRSSSGFDPVKPPPVRTVNGTLKALGWLWFWESVLLDGLVFCCVQFYSYFAQFCIEKKEK